MKAETTAEMTDLLGVGGMFSFQRYAPDRAVSIAFINRNNLRHFYG